MTREIGIPVSSASGDRVDPAGSRRRLQALACMGWDMVRLAERSNLSAQQLRNIANDAAPSSGVSPATADAVADIYAALSCKPGFTPYSMGRSAERQATLKRTWMRAAAAGWLPPMSWTPDTIDDPGAVAQPIDAAAALVELIPSTLHNGWRARLSAERPTR